MSIQLFVLHLQPKYEKQMKSSKCIILLFLSLLFSGSISAQTNFEKMMSEMRSVSKVRKYVAAPLPVMRGDVDGNGTLTTTDVAELTSRVIHPDYVLANPPAADMNADGKVSIADVVALIDELLHPSHGELNGHEYVDLGLSVKWATCNVGAYSPEDHGYYFAWGDPDVKDSYTWETYKHMTEGYNSFSGINKYQIKDGYTSAVWYSKGVFAGDKKTRLMSEDDPASVLWGEGWRTPTAYEIDQLLSRCTWARVSLEGVNGYVVEGNGNFIFLPMAGCISGKIPTGRGNYGYYWSSTLTKSETSMANSLYLTNSGKSQGFDERFYGLSVRPVCEK